MVLLLGPVIFLSSFILNGCTGENGADRPRVIQEASAFLADDKLYARTVLDPGFLSDIMALLGHGEPVLATYRFRFYRTQSWLPDLRLAQVIVKRRLRLRLITRRFEMTDVRNNHVQYTRDPQQAIGFIGNPRYIRLATHTHLFPQRRYHLDVQVQVEHQGMSRVYRVLNRLLTFGGSADYSLQTAFEQP